MKDDNIKDDWRAEFYELFIVHNQEVVSENGSHDIGESDEFVGEFKDLEAFIDRLLSQAEERGAQRARQETIDFTDTLEKKNIEGQAWINAHTLVSHLLSSSPQEDIKS